MGILNMNACIAVVAKEDEHLTGAYCFHEHGFTPAGRFHNAGYKFQKWYDIVWMEKLLGEHSAFPQDVKFESDCVRHQSPKSRSLYAAIIAGIRRNNTKKRRTPLGGAFCVFG